LRNAKGDVIRTLEDNKSLEAKMKEYALGDLHFTKIRGVDANLNAWIITPPDFDSTKNIRYSFTSIAARDLRKLQTAFLSVISSGTRCWPKRDI